MAQLVTSGNITSFSSWSLYILCILSGTYIVLPGLYIVENEYQVDDLKMEGKSIDDEDDEKKGDDIFKCFLIFFYIILLIFILQIVSSLICIFTLKNLYVIDYVLTLLLCSTFTIFVIRHFFFKNKMITKNNFYGQKSMQQQFILRSKTYQPFKACCCETCCVSYCFYIGLPIIVFFCFITMIDTVSLNDSYMNPNLDSSLGIVAGKTNGHKLFFQCTPEGKDINKSQPTVLFMHGWSGSSFDAVHVSRDPKFVATGARFCGMSRAGYDYSDTVAQDSSKSNFGYLAKMTNEGLNEMGVTGDLILMFHSLGGIQALALAHQLTFDNTINVVGAVAIDAVSVANSVDAGAEKYCSETATETPTVLKGLLLPFLLKSLPRGSYRVAANVINFMNIGTLFTWFPHDIQPRYKSNWFKLKKEDAVFVEIKDMYINCGYALKGQNAFMKMQRIETFIRYIDEPHYHIFTDFVDVTDNNKYYNVTNNYTTTIVGDKSGGLSGMHSKMLFQQKYAEEFITPGLLRVMAAVTAAKT